MAMMLKLTVVQFEPVFSTGDTLGLSKPRESFAPIIINEDAIESVTYSGPYSYVHMKNGDTVAVKENLQVSLNGKIHVEIKNGVTTT